MKNETNQRLIKVYLESKKKRKVLLIEKLIILGFQLLIIFSASIYLFVSSEWVVCFLEKKEIHYINKEIYYITLCSCFLLSSLFILRCILLNNAQKREKGFMIFLEEQMEENKKRL